MLAEFLVAWHRTPVLALENDAHRCRWTRATKSKETPNRADPGVHRTNEDRVDRRRSPQSRRANAVDGSPGGGGERMTRATATAGSPWDRGRQQRGGFNAQRIESRRDDDPDDGVGSGLGELSRGCSRAM